MANLLTPNMYDYCSVEPGFPLYPYSVASLLCHPLNQTAGYVAEEKETELFYFFRTGLVHVDMRAAELMRQSRYYISVLDCSLSQTSNASRSMRLWFGRYPGMLE